MPMNYSCDLPGAVKAVLELQGLDSISSSQYFQLECIINGENSVHQIPTGGGKTWAPISAPKVFNVLRERYDHQEISDHNRVLYIVPLVAIIISLKLELAKFGISYEVLDSEHSGVIKIETEVVIVTPEKLINKSTLEAISRLAWKAIVIDEPHYILTWGESKKRKGVLKKPFRQAFQQLNHMNMLGAPFELHTATVQHLERLFTLLGRKDSLWKKQILIPERETLTYHLIDGKGVNDIKQFPFVLKQLEDKVKGAMLIYVHKLDEGVKIFCSLNEYANENGLITCSSRSGKCIRPVAFLNANLTLARKEEIMKEVSEGKIKVLVATSSVGAGVNLPFKMMLGWGLSSEASDIVQVSGRVGRKPFLEKGTVIWVHNSSLGIRLPGNSPVRELITSSCLRRTLNQWFAHGQTFQLEILPQNCCSACMTRCVAETGCSICSDQLEPYQPVRRQQNSTSNHVRKIVNFLTDFKLNEKTPTETPTYDLNNLAEAILDNLMEFHKLDSLEEFLQMFSLGEESLKTLLRFVEKEFDTLLEFGGNFNKVSSTDCVAFDSCSEDESGGSDSSDTLTSSVHSNEYFDKSDDD